MAGAWGKGREGEGGDRLMGRREGDGELLFFDAIARYLCRRYGSDCLPFNHQACLVIYSDLWRGSWQCLFLLINLAPAVFRRLATFREVETRQAEKNRIHRRVLLGSG